MTLPGDFDGPYPGIRVERGVAMNPRDGPP